MPATLTAPQTDLLGKIQQHLAQLDGKYGFADRLARENNWTPDFARTVVDEYARFLFIAREGGHPVSPPPVIDHAWHLHLVHTEDYWGDFCPNILKMELHHSPATGTHGEAAKFADWSGQTLASYGKFFGPPPSLWFGSSRPCRPRSPAIKAGFIIIVIGLAAIIKGVQDHGENLITFGFILIALGVVVALVARVIKSKGDGTSSNCGSSCDSGTTGGGSSDSHGGHGGHGCGGHGCGGGCGGGGH
jgi:hypothetical protein